MIIRVPFGTGAIEAELPDSLRVSVVDPKTETVTGTEEERIEAALDAPIGTARLEETVKPENKVLIVVNDHTRPGPNRQIVAAVLKRLHSAGVPDANIRFICATGSHRAPTDKEMRAIVGDEVVENYEIIMHDCRDKDSLFRLGEIDGLDIWLNNAVREADFIITTGLIAPHHTAGFSGGRKGILPGVTGLDTLKVHHSLPMRPYNPSMGILEGNRFHDVALAAAKKAGVKFMINAVQDLKKQNVRYVAGDIELAHAEGVRVCREHNSVSIPGLADVVVCSPGGTPRDSDLYQAQKGLAVAETLVRPGGTVILCARSELGVGEGLFPQWMKEGESPEAIIERYKREGFNVGNNKAFMYARALLRAKIVVVSELLDHEELKEMFLDWAPDLQSALDRVLPEYENPLVTVLPRAVSMIPRVTE